MSYLKASLAAASTAASLFAFAGPAHAQAFYLQEQSARGAGRAFSGEAADTGAPSLWWNPASIAGTTEAEATLSASAILPRGEVVDTGTLIGRPGQPFAPVGGQQRSRNPITNGVLPSGAIAIPLSDRIAFGLAITSPYSFTTDYDADSWARYSADRTKLLTIDIQPSVAVAVTDWLRVGAGLNVEYTDAQPQQCAAQRARRRCRTGISSSRAMAGTWAGAPACSSTMMSSPSASPINPASGTS